MNSIDSLHLAHLLHERISRAAFINESCVVDLDEYLAGLPEEYAETIRYVVDLLREEAQRLNELSKVLVRSRCLFFEY
ncbi:hypothetical protein [Pseudomonas sp. CAM1A]|uniref:hypothetical protein n=1 Tax=Pseudomonas sp. CAM1A TaxID=3231717 RepID=UPI0039C5B579